MYSPRRTYVLPMYVLTDMYICICIVQLLSVLKIINLAAFRYSYAGSETKTMRIIALTKLKRTLLRCGFGVVCAFFSFSYRCWRAM